MIHITFHKKNTSEKIKEATLNLLLKNSYDSISMRKIAKEAGVSLGQLTYYYKTKENLILVVVKEVLEAFYIEFETKIKNSQTKFEDIISGIETTLNEDTQIEKLLITIFCQSHVNKKLQKMLQEFWNKVIDLISKCYMNEAENLKADEANLNARLLLGATIESVIEKVLGVSYNNNSTIALVRNAQLKLKGNKQ